MKNWNPDHYLKFKNDNMIEKALAEYPDMNWQVSDIVTFETTQKYDLVYSNAAIQWIPNHETYKKCGFVVKERISMEKNYMRAKVEEKLSFDKA
jgi:hypothetical protein